MAGGGAQFERAEVEVSETVGKAEIAVVRHSGARGRYFVPYRTHEASAKGNGKDFFDLSGELVFDNNETWCARTRTTRT